jgi:hypothetical protein
LIQFPDLATWPRVRGISRGGLVVGAHEIIAKLPLCR